VDLAPRQKVIGVVNPHRPEGWAHTEYPRVPSAQLAGLAKGGKLVAAATVPMDAITAMQVFDMIEMFSGQVVFVTRTAGMLGGSVVQPPRNAVLDAGFHAQPLKGTNALVDGAFIGNAVSQLVRDCGAAIALRKSHPIQDPRLRTETVSVMDGMTSLAFLKAAAKHLASGVLRLAAGGAFPFDQAGAAFAMVEETRTQGRVVLTF
jgi:NADPH:quinone reductase